MANIKKTSIVMKVDEGTSFFEEVAKRIDEHQSANLDVEVQYQQSVNISQVVQSALILGREKVGGC